MNLKNSYYCSFNRFTIPHIEYRAQLNYHHQFHFYNLLLHPRDLLIANTSFTLCRREACRSIAVLGVS